MPDSGKELISQITRLSAPGSIIVANFIDISAMQDNQFNWKYICKFGCDDPKLFLKDIRWSNISVQTPQQVAESKYKLGQDFILQPKLSTGQLYFISAYIE